MVSWEIMAMVTISKRINIYTRRIMIILVINFPALNSLLQMFSTNMNINGNKLPILVPSNSSSSNITSSSQHGSNQSLNLPEQQQHPINSSRSPLPSNSANNESSLLMCGPNTHLNSNSSLSHNHAPFPTLYPNNTGAGK